MFEWDFNASSYTPNLVLGRHPPQIDSTEVELQRSTRAILSQLRTITMIDTYTGSSCEENERSPFPHCSNFSFPFHLPKRKDDVNQNTSLNLVNTSPICMVLR